MSNSNLIQQWEKSFIIFNVGTGGNAKTKTKFLQRGTRYVLKKKEPVYALFATQVHVYPSNYITGNILLATHGDKIEVHST